MPTLFEKAYQSLNNNQRLAVDTTEGPVLVLAGPGTGKTQILTVRIANILQKSDTDPSSILALTFTEAAAREMRQRLIGLIGQPGYFVKICTFHGFCSDVITENPNLFSRPAGMKNVTDLEKIQIITDILEQGSFSLLRPINNPTLYLRDILGCISDLKREGITPQKFLELVSVLHDEFELEKSDLKKTAFLEKEKLVNKNLDLLEIYQRYQSKLVELGRFDFDDMINWVVDTFNSDPDFLLQYQEKYQYLLVDEYQDTNASQNNLLFSLSQYWGDQANIFAVGDQNQSIFGFQGASRHNLKQFEKRFPKHKKIVLNKNYRSTRTILESAASLVSDESLIPNSVLKDKPIKVAKLPSNILEDRFVLDTIKSKINSGIKPSQIAVIAKENKDIANLADLFKQNSIPFRLEGGTDILTTPLISQFLKILTVITTLHGPVDDLDLFTVLGFPYFDIKAISLLQTARQAHHNNKTLVDTLLDGHPDLDDHLVDVFTSFISWNNRATSHTAPELFQIVLQESGLLNYILSLSQPVIELNRFGTLYEDVKSQSSANTKLDLFGYVRNLSTMEINGIKLEEQTLVSNQESVTLTTAHKSKGLEWQVVLIYRFADTHWGNKTRRQMIKLPPGVLQIAAAEEDKNAEERRLFYVALTRSKQQVYISGSEKYADSAKMIFPALFINDIPKELRVNLKTSHYQDRSDRIIVSQLSTPMSPTILDGEKSYLEEIISNFVLSPTSLNNYLYCHYKFKLDNLYKIPRAKAPAMCFGTAVHRCLQDLFQETKQTGVVPNKDTFIKIFESALKAEILTKTEYNARLAHGKKILSSYYDHYKDDFPPALFIEKDFGSTRPIFLDDIALSGKADRIDLVDSNRREVRFVDYKTGSPKTRGVLEKMGDGPEGNYKRQLVFYHLIADLDKTFGYKVAQTELDFIEPDKQGHFHKERFNIIQEEIDNLKTTIKRSSKQIRSLDFDRTTDTKLCQQCDFRTHCFPLGLTRGDAITAESE